MAINEWTLRTQRATRASATKSGEGWTSTDLAFVEEFTGEATDAEIALALGRTLFAIQSITHAIRAGSARPTTRRPAPAYRGWMEGMGDE